VKTSIQRRGISLIIAAVTTIVGTSTQAADWTVPLAGNTFRTAPEPGGNGVRRSGELTWSDSNDVFSVYFHVDRPAELHLKMTASARGGSSRVQVRVGSQTFNTVIDGDKPSTHDIGSVKAAKAGYLRVDFQGVERSGDIYAAIRELLISSDTEGLRADFVRNNDGGMFYWGRRGPSVHLSYQVPRGIDLRYAYSEITVPEGQDPIGTFYMANGFGQGYFGMQVNGPQERRVLFSVWSPYKTDNPKDIPKDQRIVALARGPKVHIGEFGNEGSGGQSYLVYPWKAGRTYRFLTRVVPDGQGNTVYTSWFGDKQAGEWRLIASFRRPKTDTHLRGFHSFLESFSPAYGHIGRRAFYANTWVRDVDGNWHECTRARFSVDATGGGRHRLDFTGGSKDKRFFLRNCGFFDETGRPGESFDRLATGIEHPEIAFDDTGSVIESIPSVPAGASTNE
jgi:hypothetical protein